MMGAYSKSALRLHGMEEGGVQFPVGPPWRCAGADERGGLENRYTARYRRFESSHLRPKNIWEYSNGKNQRR